MKTAVVTGMMATYPVGGVVWDYGQYLVGLQRLGFDVFYLEDTGWQSYDPLKGVYGDDCSYGADFLRNQLGILSASLAGRWHVRGMDGASYGMPREEFLSIVADADIFLNVSGSCLLRDDYMGNRRKILIDSDPGWNHFVNYPKWDGSPGWQGAHSYREHDFFFTYAENIGQKDCVLPTMGLPWKTTRPVVDMDAWQPHPPGSTWTTVMTWNNFREPVQYQGRVYGTKEMEFVRVEDLPLRAQSRMEMAVGGADAPRGRWREKGWSVIDSHQVSKDARRYRSYIESSRGEFSVAKNLYTATKSGWFSCRSICYMAAGRPVVVQDTGYSKFIPTGRGVMAFSSLDEALKALDEVEGDYERHAGAAREIAREYFSTDVVLGKMLADIGVE